MWKEAAIPLALALALAGCSGDGSNPFGAGGSDGDDGDGDGTSITIPEDIAGNVSELIYDADGNTLTVAGVGLDNVPFRAVYTRRAALDSEYGGYKVFTTQKDALSRHATALVLQSEGSRASGRVRAGVTSTGGPRNRYFGGGYFERDGDYDPPSVNATSGLVSYAGSYAGLTNIGRTDYSEGYLAEPDASVADELRPSRSLQTDGDIYISADFADNRVEGNVYNRRLVTDNVSLPSLVLVATDIDSDGRFVGEVEYDATQSDGAWAGIDPDTVGSYAGLFAGTDAKSVGGAVALTEFDGDDQLGFDTEQEYGVFVLEQCGTAGATSSICDDVK